MKSYKQLSYTIIILLMGASLSFYIYKKIKEAQLKAEIHGIDSNNNGVRDEVEALIEKLSAGSQKSKFLYLQFAKVLQKSMEHPEQALTIVEEQNKAFRCSDYFKTNVEKETEITDIIEAETTNSPARSRAYLQYNLTLSGYVSNELEVKKEDCDFNPDLLSN